jgi:hypothetical protein
METKSGDLAVKQVSEGKVVATLARLGVRDRDGDVLVPGLLKGGQLVAIKPQHKWDHVDLGVAHVYETNQGTLEAAMEFNMAISSARDWYEAIKFSHEKKRRQQYSFGFEIEDKSFGEHEGKESRFLKRMECAEVSPVLIGASVGSETLLVKASTQRYWPGGVTPMQKGTKEHVSAAVTSLWSGMRQLHHVRHELARSPLAVKADPAFETAFEHLDAALDSLNEALVVPVEHHVPPVVIDPPKAAVTATVEPPKAVDEDDADVATSPTPSAEKGGKDSVKLWVDSTVDEVARLSTALEDIKRKRAVESERYPNGRPMSAERLEQVERLIAQLAQLKTFGHMDEQQTQAQQELQEMSERLKRLGVAV